MAGPLGKHLQAASQELLDRSRKVSASSMARTTTPEDAKRRVALLTKFFLLYPAVGTDADKRLRMAAYNDELSDIHTDVLAHAMRRLVRNPPPNARGERDTFLPSVYQIRRSAAFVIRAARNGRDPSALEHVEPQVEPNVERLLQMGPKPGEPCPWPALSPGGGAPRQLKAGT